MPAETLLAKQKRVIEIIKRLRKLFPGVKCALDHDTPFQLLVATILSAQCTDERVNQVTGVMFKDLKTPTDFVNISQSGLEKYIRSTGFFRNKAKNIKAMSKIVLEKYKNKLPGNLEELIQLPGVGRKTANVILGNAFGIPGITVDTHMGRLARRLGLTTLKDPVKVEFALNEIVPQKDWTEFSHLVIHHGRGDCDARKPLCNQCILNDLCPKIGIKS